MKHVGVRVEVEVFLFCTEYSCFDGETDFYLNFHCSIMYLYKAA